MTEDGGPLGRPPLQLMFADHPFVAVGLALDAVLRRAAFFGKQPHDGVAASRRAAVAPIRRELDGLADGKFSPDRRDRSEEHTSELQSHLNIVCRLLLYKK